MPARANPHTRTTASSIVVQITPLHVRFNQRIRLIYTQSGHTPNGNGILRARLSKSGVRITAAPLDRPTEFEEVAFFPLSAFVDIDVSNVIIHAKSGRVVESGNWRTYEGEARW